MQSAVGYLDLVPSRAALEQVAVSDNPRWLQKVLK